MDTNRLTQKSQAAVQQAQDLAARFGHHEVDGEHLLLALLTQEGGLAPRLFEKMEVPSDALVKGVEAELGSRPSVSGPGAEAGKIYITQRLQRLFVSAEEEARVLKDIRNDYWNNLADAGGGHRWRLLKPFVLDLLVGVHGGGYFGLENRDPPPDPLSYAEFRIQLGGYASF